MKIKLAFNLPDHLDHKLNQILFISSKWNDFTKEALSNNNTDTSFEEIEVTINDSIQKNVRAVHIEKVKELIYQTVFGIMIVKGPGDLNCLTLFSADSQYNIDNRKLVP